MAASFGLGLTFCRMTVEARGRIWAESGATRGATFRFVIPTAPPVIG